MSYHERNLPHCYPPGEILFLTWRPYGSLSKSEAAAIALETSGKTFAREDRGYDDATAGALWLKDKRVAQIVVDALHRGAHEYCLYDLLSWVIMANHVHVVIRPTYPVPKIMRWLKGSTARAANLLLGRTGKPFWRYETYDHYVRDGVELNRVIRYVEWNPVKAGLVSTIEAWPWSSAGAGQRPTVL